MRQFFKKWLPPTARSHLRRLQCSIKDRIHGMRSAEAVFTEVYENNTWGGRPGDYNSGTGTSYGPVTVKYIDAVSRFIKLNGLEGRRYVDLGCGDFRIGRHFVPFASEYVGVDVVDGLVVKLRREFGSETTRFLKRDLTREPLPEGEVCFIRQVMQHMSNGQISRLLPKLEKYRWVIITEHVPKEEERMAYNLDKPCGHSIRLERNSGVYVNQPPFSLPANQIRTLLEVPGAWHAGTDAGLIRTLVYTPGRSARELRT